MHNLFALRILRFVLCKLVRVEEATVAFFNITSSSDGLECKFTSRLFQNFAAAP